jgi:hypothetical protein
VRNDGDWLTSASESTAGGLASGILLVPISLGYTNKDTLSNSISPLDDNGCRCGIPDFNVNLIVRSGIVLIDDAHAIGKP